MAYLQKAGEYESEIKRGIWSYRSKSLDAFISAIDQYIKAPSGAHLTAVTRRFEEWKQRDPKEFADRGRRTEPQLRHEIRTLGKRWGVTIPVIDPEAHPEYEPLKWNDNGPIQFSTNCYAYACDDPYGHPQNLKPQPGQIAGKWFTRAEQVRGPTVRWHVMMDDLCRARYAQERRLVPLIRLRDEPIPDYVVNVPGYYLVALFTAPNRDYHWVRQDRDGMWSHKPGHDRVTNMDSDYDLIHDPRDASLRLPAQVSPAGPVVWYPYQFTTFYYAPKGGVRTGSLGALQRAIEFMWR